MTLVDRFTALAPIILGATRIVSGATFACYGAQKMFGVFGGAPARVPPALIWTAGPIEFLGGLLIAIGLFTRGAAFLCSGFMAFAYFIGHAPNGFWPIMNGGVVAILYCWLFLNIAAQGAGAFAIDNIISRTRSRQSLTS